MQKNDSDHRGTFKPCAACGSAMYIPHKGKSKAVCSPNCGAYIRRFNAPMELHQVKCPKCEEVKLTRDFYASRGNLYPYCKKCFVNSTHSRKKLEDYGLYDDHFRRLHQMFNRIRSHGNNVTEYDEREMVRLFAYFFPLKKMPIFPNEEQSKDMFYMLADLHIGIIEKIMTHG